MATTGDLRVSSRGQLSLPSGARRRWGMADGGEVTFLDLGDAVVLLPGSALALRQTLLDAVTDADWESARAGFGDPELASE